MERLGTARMRGTGILAALLCTITLSSAHADTVTRVQTTGALVYAGAKTPTGATYGTLTLNSLDAYMDAAAISPPLGSSDYPLGKADLSIQKTGTATKRQVMHVVSAQQQSIGSGTNLTRTLRLEGVTTDGNCYLLQIIDHISYTDITIDWGTIQTSCSSSGIELHAIANTTKPLKYSTSV